MKDWNKIMKVSDLIIIKADLSRYDHVTLKNFFRYYLFTLDLSIPLDLESIIF